MNDETLQPAALPPYSGDTGRCPKCGQSALEHPSIGTAWHRRPEVEATNGHSLQELLTGQRAQIHPVLHPLAPGQEALVRGCGRCSFMWLEACLDDPDLALRGMTS